MCSRGTYQDLEKSGSHSPRRRSLLRIGSVNEACSQSGIDLGQTCSLPDTTFPRANSHPPPRNSGALDRPADAARRTSLTDMIVSFWVRFSVQLPGKRSLAIFPSPSKQILAYCFNMRQSRFLPHALFISFLCYRHRCQRSQNFDM